MGRMTPNTTGASAPAHPGWRHARLAGLRAGRTIAAVIWLGERRGNFVDWVTQRWVQLTGARLARSQAPWLWGPVGSTDGIGPAFFEELAAARGLEVLPETPDAGLFPGLAVLTGPRFEPREVAPAIGEFYAHTAGFDLRIRSRWSGPFRAMGWLIARIFSRRLAQLNMPLSDRELQGGVRSRIVRLADPETGEVHHTAWVRTSVATGLPVFVGQYGMAEIPGHDGPCVKVVFPLPNGNATILLRPRVDADGGFSLVSDGRRFGDPGFYFTVVADPDACWVRYVRTMKESLSLRAEAEGVAATHRFRVFGLPFLELQYTITRKRLAAAM
jgi:hypothetical protein